MGNKANKDNSPKSGKSKKLAFAAFLVAGIMVGFLIASLHFKPLIASALNNSKIHTIRLANSSDKLVSPLLAVDVGDAKEFAEFTPLQNKISQDITADKRGGQITDIGVYFRDLASGRWTGVNQDDKFAPGSLAKVPLLIAYYKDAEANPSVLNQTLTYNGAQDANSAETIKPRITLKPNQPYTVSELLNHLIIYSDNNAAGLLVNNFDPNALSDIFTDLNLGASSYDTTGDSVTPKQLSLMFRVLYNGTYLTADWSEKALELLSQVQFKQGLVAGVPSNITVAHKFGERELVDSTTNQVTNDELHDCGIVYYPNNPYLICVMAKGNNGSLQQLQTAIAGISATVYTEVSNGYK